MGGGLLLHWDQTVGTGASIGLARHGLNKRETAMRNSGDDNYDDYVAEIKAADLWKPCKRDRTYALVRGDMAT
ncbi:hypothetical protein SADUNF_Sadunf11G0099200 [Salix dunnii]|uniref:Uncharacterized protein n=1 Tax=Salix dunnii TaxID=1413687 RepID=A0A835MPG4_9ROSI|nr:hypothetical protein SADUNF_Sadunf11G0099200 [Salix dunnii]